MRSHLPTLVHKPVPHRLSANHTLRRRLRIPRAPHQCGQQTVLASPGKKNPEKFPLFNYRKTQMPTEEDQIIVDAKFCVDNPDVLHTPGQHRTIIHGLLDRLDERVECKGEAAPIDIRLEPVPHVGV